MGSKELIEKIRSDGRARVAEIQRERDEKVSAIVSRGDAEVSRIEEESRTRTERETRLVRERAEARSRLDRRKALLAARWEVIDRVFARAAERVVEDDSYVGLLAHLVKTHASADATVVLSKDDAGRYGSRLGVKVATSDSQSGGILIRTGRQVLDFSLDESLAAIRDESASEVAALLFPKRRPGDEAR